MSRIRTIYNNEALLIGPSPATGAHTTGNIKRVQRVQTLGSSFDYALEDINELGKLAAVDRVNTEGVNANEEFSYLVTDWENEKNLGFVVASTTNALGDFLNGTQEDRNYFRYVAPEGLDADGLSAASGAVLGLGNGYISSYSLEIGVGAFPTATVSVQGLNMTAHTDGVAEPIPAVDPTTGRKASGTFTLPTIPSPAAVKPSVIKPGDARVTFSNANAGAFQSLADGNLRIQSASVSFDLNLEPIRALGSRLPISREVTYPVEVQVSIEALMTDLVAYNLVDFLCTEPATDITIDLFNDNCDSGGPALDQIYAKLIVKNAKLSSQDFSTSIGPNNTVTMEFTAQVGAANDTANGLFMSGVVGYSGSTPLFSA